MSTRSPYALLPLAIDSLLKDQAIAIEAVAFLPGELFPQVFLEAVGRKHTAVIKAMVQFWPFPSLPLGTLMNMTGGILDMKEEAQKRVLQAVLDGLDVLLSQEVCSRRLRLKVLDVRDIHRNFWAVWSGYPLEKCPISWRTAPKTGLSVPNKKTLKITLDLQISENPLCPLASCLVQWVKERNDLVQLGCPKLCVTAKFFLHITDVLDILDLDSVQEVAVGHQWTISMLAQFAPFLGRMKNLHKLILSDIFTPAITYPEQREQWISIITSQLLNLHCLQQLLMNNVDFLEGHMDQLLRSLALPLETLVVIDCQSSFSDWKLLPYPEQIRHLKHLVFFGTRLTFFSPEPLQHLLKNVSATLTTLHLENCGITDAQLSAFLPSLSCCSQLTTLCFIRNFLSIGTMKNLLCHTARLNNLNLEMYSPPEEVSVAMHGIQLRRMVDVHDALRRIIKPLNHPREVWFCIFSSEMWCHWKLYKSHTSPCLCCVAV